MKLNLASALTAGADEVTEALADCCCSVSGGMSAHCKMEAHAQKRTLCSLLKVNSKFSYSSRNTSSVM